MVIVPIVSAAAIFYGRTVRNLSKQASDATADLSKFAQEKLGNIRTVRAFAKENVESEKYATFSDNVFNLGIKEGTASAVFFSTVRHI